jgi:cytochrome c oxidase subunit 2
MALEVVAASGQDHDAWLAAQAAPAIEPTTDAGRFGKSLFLAAGCGGCHTIRGTSADGAIGPDLTHVASRRFLAANTLAFSRENLARFISQSQHIKPENRMPPYRIFSPAELQSIATYLEGLR